MAKGREREEKGVRGGGMDAWGEALKLGELLVLKIVSKRKSYTKTLGKRCERGKCVIEEIAAEERSNSKKQTSARNNPVLPARKSLSRIEHHQLTKIWYLTNKTQRG